MFTAILRGLARSATGISSRNDLHRLGRIKQLLAERLNLAGIALVLHLQDDNAQLRRETEQNPRPPA